MTKVTLEDILHPNHCQARMTAGVGSWMPCPGSLGRRLGCENSVEEGTTDRAECLPPAWARQASTMALGDGAHLLNLPGPFLCRKTTHAYLEPGKHRASLAASGLTRSITFSQLL